MSTDHIISNLILLADKCRAIESQTLGCTTFALSRTISSIPDKKLLKDLEVPFYRTYPILNLK
jgi:hypothetical protein